MDGILTWLFAGADCIPELVVIIKVALMFYGLNYILDILDLLKKGGRL